MKKMFKMLVRLISAHPIYTVFCVLMLCSAMYFIADVQKWELVCDILLAPMLIGMFWLMSIIGVVVAALFMMMWNKLEEWAEK